MCEIVSLIAIKSKIGAPDKCRLSRCEQLFVKKVSHGHEAEAHDSEMRVAEADFKIRWRGTRMDHDLRGERRISCHVRMTGQAKIPPMRGWRRAKALRVSKVSRKKTPTGCSN